MTNGKGREAKSRFNTVFHQKAHNTTAMMAGVVVFFVGKF
jgi:hypothetical protein